MPYIDEPAKERIRRGAPPTHVGELTFVMFDAGVQYVKRKTTANATFRYSDLAEVLAAMEAAKLEFYRRVVAPYEDAKIQENGDCI